MLPQRTELVDISLGRNSDIFGGQVAELVYAHDSKSCSLRIEGSIPSLPTKNIRTLDSAPLQARLLRQNLMFVRTCRETRQRRVARESFRL